MIELRHLRCFVAVAEELSFRRAAERVHGDQSSLSRTIRGLEADLGVLLFARTPRTLRLTPAGEVLLQEVRAAHCISRMTIKTPHTHIRRPATRDPFG